MMTKEPSISSSRDRNACCCCSGLSGSPYIMPACAPLPAPDDKRVSWACGRGQLRCQRRLRRRGGPAVRRARASRRPRRDASVAGGAPPAVRPKTEGTMPKPKPAPGGGARPAPYASCYRRRRVRQVCPRRAAARGARGACGGARGGGTWQGLAHLHGRPLRRRARRDRHAVHRQLARVFAVAAAAVQRHHLGARSVRRGVSHRTAYECDHVTCQAGRRALSSSTPALHTGQVLQSWFKASHLVGRTAARRERRRRPGQVRPAPGRACAPVQAGPAEQVAAERHHRIAGQLEAHVALEAALVCGGARGNVRTC